MFFYVYLAPQVISVAQENGPLGMQALIAILRGLVENCFVADFEDHRVQTAIGQEIQDLPEDYDRKIVKEILSILAKRHRFLYCLIPDYDGVKSDTECVKEQAEVAMLDLLLLEDDEEYVEHVETATVLTYQHTEFEANRAKLIADGLTLVPNAMDGNEFMENYLKKGLRPARSIVICDKLFGEKYKGNYQYTTQRFFRWLETILVEPDSCVVTFHCAPPDPENGARDLEVMRRELAACKSGRIAGIRLKLQLYSSDTTNFLPHQRYLLTDQLALSIDPGMDFLDPRTGQIRSISFSYKSMEQVDKLLKSYEAGRQPEIDL
jgi:hypothetical protein